MRISGTSRIAAGIFAALLLTSTIGVLADGAGASIPPRAELPDQTVTADALPTVQVDGVVWDQEVVGDTVYVVGDFDFARPAGSAPGTNLVPRSNMLAYDLATGVLRTDFVANLDSQGKTVVASPDGSRIYVGGQFTQVNGVNQYRIAALDPQTGAVIPGFNAVAGYIVNDLVATDDVLYAGGAFGYAGANAATPRDRLAAFSTSNGNLLAWAPSADNRVETIALSTDGTRVFAGGQFLNVNGQSAYGMASIDAVTGELVPFAANQTVQVGGVFGGQSGAILDLRTKDGKIYGGGYTYGRSGGNLEGVFRADEQTGQIEWVEDCHGDTYQMFPVNGLLYKAAHTHLCSNYGGQSQSSNQYTQWLEHMRFSVVVEDRPAGTIRRDNWNYHNWEGFPAPSTINWYPDYTIGSFTGQNQATWAVDGTEDYVVYGGEFQSVNGVGQQGLVRYARRDIAPKQQGPRLGGPTYPIEVVSPAAGQVRVTAPANWDRDTGTLDYRITRDGATVHTERIESTFFDRPTVYFLDTAVTPGATHQYRIVVTDADGNTAVSPVTPVTVRTSGDPSPYAEKVLEDGARIYWRMGEASGATVANDAAGFNDGAVNAMTFGRSGAILGDADTAASPTGTSSRIVQPGLVNQQGRVERHPVSDDLSIETWFRTTSTQGGRLVGFGDSDTGSSSSNGHDRMLYVTNDGRVQFGVRTRTAGFDATSSRSRLTVASNSGLNDGQWHHVVGTLSPEGMRLFVDGIEVGSRADVNSGHGYYGFWRVGADTINSGWPSAPSSTRLNGDIDETAVYGRALAASTIADHYELSGRVAPVKPPPGDAYGNAVYDLDPFLYYRLAETSGTVAVDSGVRVHTGDYAGTTVRDQDGVVAGNPAVAFSGDGSVSTRTALNAPGTYSVETWFNTTTTTGGKLIGFGSARSGLSGNADRHVFLRDDGRLTFGVGTSTPTEVTTDAAYNDGQWHHVVATHAPDGLRLYVDGLLRGSAPTAAAGGYVGYWRIGGDVTPAGSTSNYFTGRLDEAAVYDTVITPAQALWHFRAANPSGINEAPTAAFTWTADELDATFDASGSGDLDGSITSWAWDFGDGSTGTGETTAHSYAADGTYTVTLTVTDDGGATGTATQTVDVAATPEPNVAPTASFVATPTELDVAFDATGSDDSDGTITDWSWTFGDGTNGTGETTAHTYAADGTYTVTLTVTDDDGETATATQTVDVAATPEPNVAPTASFVATPTELDVAFDATGSDDSDGSITDWSWTFGDGANGTGETTAHSYGGPGTYTVTLTVTDDDGETATATQTVTVDSAGAPEVFVTDGFDRTVENGLGNADVGGSWSTAGTVSNYSVSGGQGRHRLPVPGTSTQSYLPTVAGTDVMATIDLAYDRAATGGGYYTYVAVRRVGNSDYRARVRVTPTDTSLTLFRLDNGTYVSLGAVGIPGLVYSPGEVLRLRMEAVGTNPTTISARVWRVGEAEPTAWQVSATDSAAALQGPGGTGLMNYLSGSANNAPSTVLFDNVLVGEPGVTPPPEIGNRVPVAAFEATPTDLQVAFDGTGSVDPDGTITDWSWDFGDGTSGVGSTVVHDYAAAGSYTVTLVVTDDEGATDDATATVTVFAPGGAQVLAADDFEREVVDGFGSADLGGAWANSGSATQYSVSAGTGRQQLQSPGVMRESYLTELSVRDVRASVDIAFDKAMTGGGVYSYLAVRRIGSSDYRARVRFMPGGTTLTIYRVVNGGYTALAGTNIAGLVYAPGEVFRLQLEASGASPTTLGAKLWRVGDAEPTDWQVTATDSTSALQAPGGLGLANYLSGSATDTPIFVFYDRLLATEPEA